MTKSNKKKQKRLAKKLGDGLAKGNPQTGASSSSHSSGRVEKKTLTVASKAEEKRRRRQEVQQRARAGFVPGNSGTLSDLIARTEEKIKEHDHDGDDTMETNDVEDGIRGTNAKHSTDRTYYKEFLRVVDAADVVLQVLDARDPLGTRCNEVEAAIKQQRSKRLVLVLNKADLVPKENLQEWITYLRGAFPTVAFKASTQSQGSKLGQAYGSVGQNTEATLQTSKSVGAKTLLALLGNYTRNKDVKTAIRIGVVGYPNVGKSSLINSLKRSKACQVGNTPGVTKVMQEIQLDSKIKLLDCPGMVLTNNSTSTATELKNAVKIEQIDDPLPLVEQVLQRCEMAYFMDKYNVGMYHSADHFLALLAIRLGKLKRGGIPDKEKAARTVLTDWNNGKIRYFSVPPEASDSQVSSAVLTNFSSEFNLDAIDALQQADMDTIEDEEVAREAEMQVTAAPPRVAKEVKQVEPSKKKREKKALEYISHVGPEAFGPGRAKKAAKLREKKVKKDRRRRDKVAMELSEGLEKAFALC